MRTTTANDILHLLEDSHLHYTKLNLNALETTQSIHYIADIEGGSLDTCNIDLGGYKNIHEWEINMLKEESHFNISSLIKNRSKQTTAHIVNTNHQSPECESDQDFKQILDGHSHAIFDSQIRVDQGCSGSKAFQHSQTILLSDDARINNEPRLMIFHDELEASHGATIGSLDENAINYLKLRGLNQTQCEDMLIEGIENEILNKIASEPLRAYIKTLIAHRAHLFV